MIIRPYVIGNGPTTVRTCRHCGAQFLASISALKYGRGRFCSRRCLGFFTKHPPTVDASIRFWSRVNKGEASGGCWIWTGACRGGIRPDYHQRETRRGASLLLGDPQWPRARRSFRLSPLRQSTVRESFPSVHWYGQRQRSGYGEERQRSGQATSRRKEPRGKAHSGTGSVDQAGVCRRRAFVYDPRSAIRRQSGNHSRSSKGKDVALLGESPMRIIVLAVIVGVLSGIAAGWLLEVR